MAIKKEKLYKIHDSEWTDNNLLTEKEVIEFTVEHFWDREDEFSNEEDFKKCVGREDGTNNFYKADGTYNLCKYSITEESKKLFTIAQKIRNNQPISFADAKKFLKEMDFEINLEH